jgi:predicted DNA-binding protein (MmcQ/YjbR family)
VNTDWVRGVCMKLPHTTEEVLWGGDLVFKIGGKMYAVAALEPGKVCLSFKCSPENFAELVERESIIPAPYLARHHWVALQREDAVASAELKRLLGEAYELVLAKLPKKAREELVHRRGAEKNERARRKQSSLRGGVRDASQ